MIEDDVENSYRWVIDCLSTFIVLVRFRLSVTIVGEKKKKKEKKKKRINYVAPKNYQLYSGKRLRHYNDGRKSILEKCGEIIISPLLFPRQTINDYGINNNRKSIVEKC